MFVCLFVPSYICLLSDRNMFTLLQGGFVCLLLRTFVYYPTETCLPCCRVGLFVCLFVTSYICLLSNRNMFTLLQGGFVCLFVCYFVHLFTIQLKHVYPVAGWVCLFVCYFVHLFTIQLKHLPCCIVGLFVCLLVPSFNRLLPNILASSLCSVSY